MSYATFIPEIWSARILEAFDNALIYGNLFNRDYEGDISAYGDTVHINELGEVTIKEYTKSQDIDAPEELSTTEQLLVIDQGDYFNFAVEDVDAAQMRAPVIDRAASNAAYGFSAKVDTYLAGLLAADGKITKGLGSDASPLVIDAKNAYEYMVHMRTEMDKANVPKDGRWIVMPPEFEGMMLLDSRFASAEGSAAENRLVNGAVARAAGINIHISNNVPNTGGSKFKVTASTNAAGTFANQILETEAYRPEKRFSDAIKGLHVYGAKVIRPEIVAVATVSFDGGVAAAAEVETQSAKSSK